MTPKISSRKIVGNVLLRATSEILQTGKALLLLPLISRLFGVAGYGIWSQIGVTLVLFIPILSLRLDAAQVRYTCELSPSDQGAPIVFSSLAATLALGAMLLAAGWLTRHALAVAMFADIELSTYAILFLGLLVTRAGLRVALAYYHARLQTAFYTMAEGGLALLELLGLLVAAWGMKSSFTIAIGVVLFVDVAVLLAVVGDILRRERRIAFSLSILSKLLRYSIPLVPVIALAWVVSASDRYVIVHYLGLAQAGTYSAAYRLAQVLRLFIQPILFVLFPIVARLWSQREPLQVGKELSNAVRWFAILAIPATAGLAAVGSAAMQWIGGNAFVTSDLLVSLLVISELLLGISLIYGLALYLQERSWTLPLLFLGIGALNLALNLLWIRELGILGAAIATCLCRLVQVVVVVIIIKRLIHAPFPWRTVMKASIASAGVYVVANLVPRIGVTHLGWRVLAGAIAYGLLAIALGVVRKQDLVNWRTH